MVLGIIVTYNPEIKRLKKNINSIKNQVDFIVIIDNFSKNILEIEKLTKQNKIKILKNDINLGIAEALNMGLKEALENNFKYILTLDQDSIAEDNMVNILKKGFELDKNIGIVSPTIFDLNLNEISSLKMIKEYEKVETSITSGSLCNVKKLLEVNGFETKLFIDCVDFDICYKLKEKGYKVLLSKNSILNHEVGKSEIKKILNIKFVITNHNSDRVYFIFRNRIYLIKRYTKIYNFKFYKELLKLLKRILGILIFEKNRKEKFISIVKGIRDSKKLLESENGNFKFI